jgi:hypothetical protein
MTEKELRTSIVRAAREFGWRVYFTWSSMHSPAGFPDLVLVRSARLIFAELKAEKGKTTPDQDAWLADLRQINEYVAARSRVQIADGTWVNFTGYVPPEVYVWRPADLEDAYRVLM